MNEDDARNGKDDDPKIPAVFRHMALNIIRKEQSKGSTSLEFKGAADRRRGVFMLDPSRRPC